MRRLEFINGTVGLLMVVSFAFRASACLLMFFFLCYNHDMNTMSLLKIIPKLRSISYETKIIHDKKHIRVCAYVKRYYFVLSFSYRQNVVTSNR